MTRIRHICGHRERHRIGSVSPRTRGIKLRRWGNQLCSRCAAIGTLAPIRRPASFPERKRAEEKAGRQAELIGLVIAAFGPVVAFGLWVIGQLLI